jgi:hypothetical protein
LPAYLRLNGVQAKEHPVFKELTRVKQYFEKIKVAEAGPTKPRENLSLNKEAAGRVIKHALVCLYDGHPQKHEELIPRHRLGRTKLTLRGQKERPEKNSSPRGS